VVAAPKQPNGKIQKSLVRITSTEVEPDYRAPWNTGAIGRGVGAGFVIEGPRIMTNAHVVSNTRYLTVERDGDPNKYSARVVFVAHDCDLALITVDSPEFFKNMVPLGFGGSNPNEAFLNFTVWLLRSRNHDRSNGWGSRARFCWGRAFFWRWQRRSVLLRCHRWSVLLLQRRSILLPEKSSVRTKQQRVNEKTFHAKV